MATQSQLIPESPTTALATIEQFTPIELFRDGKLRSIVDRIKAEARAIDTDISTEAGRKAIASLAYKVSRSKTFIEEQRVKLVADEKKRLAAIDAEGRAVREELDALRDEIRKPLTDWENAEKARIDAHEGRIARMGTIAVGCFLTIDSVNTALTELDSLFDHNFQEFTKRATQVHERAALHLRSAAERLAREEVERIGRERERRQAEERERLAREAKIAEEARLKAEAEAKRREEALAREAKQREEEQARVAAEEKARLEREKKAAEDRARKAEEERVAAEKKAEADKKAAAKKAEDARIAAEKQAAADREAAVAAERKRQEDARKAERAAEAKRNEGKVMLVLTRSQHMALQSFLADYIRMPQALEASVDVVTDTATTPIEILNIVMNAPGANTR